MTKPPSAAAETPEEYELCHDCGATDGNHKYSCPEAAMTAETPDGSETPTEDFRKGLLSDAKMLVAQDRRIKELETLLTAAQKERDALNEQFEAAGLFVHGSFDSGKTWQKYTLEARVRMAISTCLDDDEAKQIEALESELAAERGRREEAERELEELRK